MVSGMTGVQAPLMYPYYPGQLKGLLGAIKGAAEYESLVNDWILDDGFRTALIEGGMSEEDAGPLAEEFAREPGQVSTWVEGAQAAADRPPESMAKLIDLATGTIPGEFLEGQRRMGPQRSPTC